MKNIVISAIMACTMLLSAPCASANSPETIRQTISAGDYASAFSQAETLETAEGYALAAESLLSEIMLGQAENNKKQAKRARKLTEAALALDPTHQNARLQFALADGFVARETGDVSAWMKKLQKKTEAIVQAYRMDFPEDPRGSAMLGAWHLTIARKAGGKNAEKWFGASVEQGQSLFRSAQTVWPDDVIIGVNYAFALLALADEDLEDSVEARQTLQRIASLTAEDHMSTVLKTYAAQALKNIEDRSAVRAYADLFLNGKVPVFSAEED